MKLRTQIILICVLLLLTANSFGQNTRTRRSVPPPITPSTVRSSSMNGIPEGDPVLINAMRQKEVEDTAKVPKVLKEKYQEFLKTPNSGITKIFSWEDVNTIDANQKRKPVLPECSFFSFESKKHHPKNADIRFSGGVLHSGFAEGSFAAIRLLGEKPISDITLDSPDAASLLRLSPLGNVASKGKAITDNGDEVQNPGGAEPVPGKSYLLRSAFSGEHDLLIAFQVVEKSDDGSIIIIWKRLSKTKSVKF